ncbi:MAG: hypothetical protein ACREAF_05750 [Nitrosopumilaceae archaeon]
MKSRKYIYAGIGAAAVIAAIIASLYQFNNVDNSNDALNLDFTYAEANSNIKDNLQSKGIVMSSPITLQKSDDIRKYCSFLSEEKQKLVQHCTSTEMEDNTKEFLGNVHILGTSSAPQLVIVALQSDPTLQNLDDVKTVLGATIDELVCTCWSEVKPGGYGTVDDLVSSLLEAHLKEKKPETHSSTIPLASKNLRFVLTTNQQGYEWQLLISR